MTKYAPKIKQRIQHAILKKFEECWPGNRKHAILLLDNDARFHRVP